MPDHDKCAAAAWEATVGPLWRRRLDLLSRGGRDARTTTLPTGLPDDRRENDGWPSPRPGRSGRLISGRPVDEPDLTSWQPATKLLFGL